MKITEGRGFILKSGADTPYAGWICASQLDHHMPIQAAPWMLVRMLGELCQLFPGGCALLWDLPLPTLSSLPHEVRAAFWSAVGHLPGLSLHFRDADFAVHLDGPVSAWFHGPLPPEGDLGQAWRQGWIGWVPETGPAWRLPGLGKAEGAPECPELPAPGCLWGELVLPLAALAELNPEDVARAMADTQARLEQDLSLRLSATAWPVFFPFHRRRAAWRVAVLGGREFRQAGGTWEDAAKRLADFCARLAVLLRTPVWAGTSEDVSAGSVLGHQAMREALPWRHALPLPPTAPVFTPGLAADPRDPAPLESRSECPEALLGVVTHPPVARLRVPRVPGESGVSAFLRGASAIPAIQWMPPELVPSGPYTQEHPWASPGAFVPLMDVASASQPGLFDDLDA